MGLMKFSHVAMGVIFLSFITLAGDHLLLQQPVHFQPEPIFTGT